MKAILLKPVDGLEVGQVYELIEQRGGYLTWRNIVTNEEIEYIFNGGYKTFYNYWFVFQELPEQLKTRVRNAIEENAGATSSAGF